MGGIDALQLLNRQLPTNEDGAIISPLYVPVRSAYLDKWRTWCKAHPKSEWPAWLVTDAALLKRKLKLT